MASSTIKNGLLLNTGARIPCIGLGTWKSPASEVSSAVSHALIKGYRHIDGAMIYGNEVAVGRGIKNALETDTSISREDIFVTSKIFNDNHGKEKVLPTFEKTMEDLDIDYLDLYLIHWPIKFDCEEIPNPMRKPDGSPAEGINPSFEYLETWKAMEELLHTGKVKAIGVSNFTKDQIQDIIDNCSVIPAVNQVEFHPLLVQQDLLDYCKEKGVILTAYSPLGSPDSYSGKLAGAPSLLSNDIIAHIASKRNKTNAQVLLRWSIQKGVSVIPKSVTPKRIEENVDVFDFDLTMEEMDTINALNCNHRFGMGWLPGHYL